MLSDSQLKKFQELYKNSFGVDLSKKEALEKGLQLVSLFQVVYKPITKSQLRKLKRKRKEKANAPNVEQALQH